MEHAEQSVRTGAQGARVTLRKSLFCGGLLLGLTYVAVAVDAELGRSSEVDTFTRAADVPDQSSWSRERIREFAAVRQSGASHPIALIRIPSLQLVVPLYETATELHLNRGVGLIEHMAQPGEGGNLGIAGHRDGFFRALKDIARGDLIEVQTHQRTYKYRVVATQIVAATDTTPLTDTIEPTVTLVTCYPFYYLGHAPQRFIVRGRYLQKE
jgi:LPXTG-site transpeptidase (sortase) family protein